MYIKALQRHRINRVVNFTRNHASDILTLDTLADVACLSRFHFSRVFAEHCHETPIEFVSRVRLEQSISNLIYQPHKPVTAIALESGFSGSQAFSNAFRRRFGISARDFRFKNSWYVTDFPRNQYVLSPSMAMSPSRTPHLSQNKPVVLKTMPSARLAYLRHRGAYYNPSNGRRAQLTRLIGWAKTRGLWQEDTPIIGVCPDHSAVTPAHFCQYDFGIAVEDGVSEDDLISIQNRPEITLATLSVTGSSVTGRQAWRWLISHWLPQSGMTLAEHAFYEIFKLNDGCPGDPERTALLCLPVTPAN